VRWKELGKSCWRNSSLAVRSSSRVGESTLRPWIETREREGLLVKLIPEMEA
jgi:hypothetical protein